MVPLAHGAAAKAGLSCLPGATDVGVARFGLIVRRPDLYGGPKWRPIGCLDRFIPSVARGAVYYQDRDAVRDATAVAAPVGV